MPGRVTENWYLTLKMEGRLGVLENMVLRRIFKPTREEATLWTEISKYY
jgi:hypothetical protein